eukprot:9477912-Pyramimonas_sp.AAC.3
MAHQFSSGSAASIAMHQEWRSVRLFVQGPVGGGGRGGGGGGGGKLYVKVVRARAPSRLAWFS